MTFLNPFVLIGLAAASIPLILHLLQLHKPRTIEFSTLAFLKELQRTSIRRLKLRQILLLILRTALIIFVVFAFARPALRGSILGSIGTHARTSVIVLLDDSFSMKADDDQGELFKQAKEKALQLIAMLKEGDEVCWLRMSDLPRATMETPTHDFAELSMLIGESVVSSASGSLDEGLRLCAKVLAKTHNANKEVYIVSDMQRTLFPQKLRTAGDAANETLFPPETKFFLVRFGLHETDNSAVDSVAILSRIFEKGKPVKLTARIRNWGKSPVQDYVASVYLDGSRVAQRNVDVPPWSSTTVDFTVIPKRSGFLNGSVSIENDAITDDNRRFFVFSVPEKITLACVSPSPEDLRFVSLALSARSGENNLFDVHYTTPQQFALVDLNKTDGVLFSNVQSFTPNDVDRIKLFVEHGGGIVIFPGSAINDDKYNTTLLPALKIPPFEGRKGTSSAPDNAGALVFQNVDTDHPIFSGVFESSDMRKQLSIESPQIFLAVKRQTGKQGSTVISLSDQTPFLSDYRIGKGVVLVFSSAPTPSWTDFPFKGIFAPLIHRAILFAVSQTEQSSSFTVGDEPILTIKRSGKATEGRSTHILRYPSGTEELLQKQIQSTPVGSTVLFALKKFTEPGIYEIRAGQHPLSKFTVNVPQRESDLRKISSDELENFFAALRVDHTQIKFVDSDDNLESAVLQSRYGVELWRFCIIAALVCALIEMAVARSSHPEAHPTAAAV